MTVDLSKILDQARGAFKNKEKGLGLQMVLGSDIYTADKPSDYVYWPDSPWSVMTGVPGCPFGKIVQVAGKPDSGKSTHGLKFMKLAQEQDHIIILWDPEEKFSASRFDRNFGGSSTDILAVRSKVILDGADMLQALIDSSLSTYKDKKVFVVWDSVGGSISKGENEKDFRASTQMAEAAKENGRVVRGLVRLMEKYRNLETNEHRLGVFLVNQTYSNIGAPGQKEAGGQKIEFHSSLILQLQRVTDLFKIRDKVKRKIGITTRARVKKNHLFDGLDTIAELKLNITAGEISVNSKDPAAPLVPALAGGDQDLVEGDPDWGSEEQAVEEE